MNITSYRMKDSAIINIQGEFDTKKCLEFKDEILQLLADDILQITVNVQEMDFIDSPGIGVLLSTAFSLKKAFGSLTLKNPQVHILDLLEATQVSKHLEVISEEVKNIE